jgi:hypothetical protein
LTRAGGTPRFPCRHQVGPRSDDEDRTAALIVVIAKQFHRIIIPFDFNRESFAAINARISSAI